MVPDFDVTRVRPDSVVFVIGKRSSGKTSRSMDSGASSIFTQKSEVFRYDREVMPSQVPAPPS